MHDNQLATTNTGLIQTLDDMDRVAKQISGSGMFGITKPEQAMTLMLICQAEGLNPISALRRYHLIEGKPSMRADAMQGEFEQKGSAIVWHVRTDEAVAGTAFLDRKKIDDTARSRAVERFDLLWRLEFEDDSQKRSALVKEIAKLSREGEETLIRTFSDAVKKGIAIGKGDVVKANWAASPRQMLTARFVTEVVRLLNPGLVAGIYSEDETADIVRHEKEAEAAMLKAPSPRDREAIMGMIAQHDQELETATGERRRVLLGLRSELNCKLADIGAPEIELKPEPKPTVGGVEVKMADPVIVEPPKQEAKPEPKVRTKKEPTPQPEPEREGPWQEVICHVGKSGGSWLGRTLGELFKRAKTKENLAGLVEWFAGQALATSEVPKDRALWKAVMEARDAWTPPGGPATPEPTKEAKEQPEAPTEPATPQGWRDVVPFSRNPKVGQKKLGERTPEEIRWIHDEFLPTVDWEKSTAAQNEIKLNVKLAMLELFPKEPELLPPAANSEVPAHTEELNAAIKESGLMRGDFMQVCSRNGWIARDAQKIADISEDEASQLLSDWETVVDSVKAQQP